MAGNHSALGASIREVSRTSHLRGSESERWDLLLNESENLLWHFLDLTEYADLAIGIGDMWRE